MPVMGPQVLEKWKRALPRWISAPVERGMGDCITCLGRLSVSEPDETKVPNPFMVAKVLREEGKLCYEVIGSHTGLTLPRR